jgi:hypothetical protein
MSIDGEARRSDGPAGFNPYAEPEALGGGVELTPEDEAAAAAGGAIAVTFRNTDEDIAAFLAHQLARQQGRLGMTVGALMPSFLAWVAVNALFYASGRYNLVVGILMGGGGVVVLALGPWLVRRLVGRMARKEAGKKAARSEMTVEISPEGVVTRIPGQPGAAARSSWPTVTAIEETGDHIFLKESKSGGDLVTARVIPRRAFATPEAAEVFVRAARRWKAAAREDATAAVAPDPDALSVTFTLDDEDRRRRRALRGKALRRQQWKLTWIVGVPLAGTLYCGYQVAWLLRLPSFLRWPRLPIYVAFLVPSVYLLVGALRLSWKLLVRWSKAGEDGPTTVEIAPAGFVVRQGGGKEEARAWEATPFVGGDDHDLKLGSQVIDARRGVILMHLIPRRAFATPERAEEFLARAMAWHADAIARLKAGAAEAPR